jgi:hypothetical protein
MRANLLRAVRSALARTRSLSGHPDANLLAAFAENTLLARERAAVSEHLADCAECREFLALAFATEVAEPAVAVKPRAIRRWRPVWSWAATASTAAVCIVASAVWEFRAQRVAPPEPPPGPSEITAPMPPQTAAPVKAAPVKAAAPRRFTPPPAATPGAAAKQQEAPPPPPALPPQQTADALSVVPQQVAAPQYKQRVAAEVAPAPLPPPALARSTPASIRTPSAFGVMGRPALARSVAISGPPVVWTTASGVVQRSNDGGATWVTVPISDQVSFLAVAHFGRDVWAGGSAGALFHSADSGAHWERVAINATGAVITIRAGAKGEVVVTTDTRQRWLTLDDGRTWRLTDTPH